MSYSATRKKFNSIKYRAFKSHLDLFLICIYIKNRKLANFANLAIFAEFNYNDPDLPLAASAYQLSKDEQTFNGRPVKELDDQIEKWHQDNELKPYKEYFINHRIISWEDFKALYGPDDSTARSCHYCEISEQQIKELIAKGQIKTKRLPTRGRTMEIERLKPNEGYTKDNIVLCCYWCNNAKTDEFTSEEFQPLCDAMKIIWERRLKLKNQSLTL